MRKMMLLTALCFCFISYSQSPSNRLEFNKIHFSPVDTLPAMLLASDTSIHNGELSITFTLKGFVVTNQRLHQELIKGGWVLDDIEYLDYKRKPLPKSYMVWDHKIL